MYKGVATEVATERIVLWGTWGFHRFTVCGSSPTDGVLVTSLRQAKIQELDPEDVTRIFAAAIADRRVDDAFAVRIRGAGMFAGAQSDGRLGGRQNGARSGLTVNISMTR